MLAHHLYFFRRERARLQQNRIRNGDFAYVMNDSGPPQSLDRVFLQAQALAEPRRHLRQAFAVSVSIRVARFDASRQREENRLCVFEFVGVVLETQERASAREKFAEIERLAEKIVRSGVDAFDAVLGGGKPGDEHDGRQAGFGRAFDLPAHFETIHAGHYDVEEDHVRAKRGAFDERGFSVVHFTHVEAFAAQQQLERKAGGQFVIDDQDFAIHSKRINVSCRPRADKRGIRARFCTGCRRTTMETREMKRMLHPDSLREIAVRLEQAHRAFQKRYPGSTSERQPVHTVYGGAHLFRADVAKRLGEAALRSLDEFAPDFATFARVLALPGAEHLPDATDAIATIAKSIEADPEAARKENRAAWFASTIYRRVREKLKREPVEDFRIDFEDGYGNRPDAEEDGHAAAAAGEVAAGLNSGELPPFIGIRIKPFTEELRERSIRTMDIFLTELASKTRGQLPRNFFLTLPKVSLPDEVAALADLCSRFEPLLDLEPGALRFELMIETTQSILNERGEVNLLPLVTAGRGRCVAAHFGTYDYTAGRNITAAHQHMRHPACDFAKEMMQVALAGTGTWLSDGATNILPVAPHRAGKNGAPLRARQAAENRAAVHSAWKLHFDDIQHSLVNGFYQGWDLHPAQLSTRYAAVYSFFLSGLDSAAERLRNFIDKAAQATLVGEVFDDAATGQGLLNYFLRATNCGAITAEEAQALTGLTLAEFRSGSFVKILDGRKK
jgi:hypothetical protein